MKTIKTGTFEIINIKLLNPSDINRAIDENHVSRFKNKLTQFGWLDPIKVDNNNNILEGHHRYYAALNLRVQNVPIYKVFWLNNLTEKERLAVILQYNASNLNWTNESYLEKYALLDQSYAKAFNKWKIYNSNLSTGTILKLYLTGSTKKFRAGESLFIDDVKKADFLANKLSHFVDTYGKKKAQAYALREVVNVCQNANGLLATNYILCRYEDMLKNNHNKLTSIADFRPHINDILAEFELIKND